MSWWEGGTWTPEQKVSGDEIRTIDKFPSAALDEYGGLWVAWSHYDDTVPPWDTDVRASVCTKTTPVSFGPAIAEVSADSVVVRWAAGGEASNGPFTVWRSADVSGEAAPQVHPPPDAICLTEDPIIWSQYVWVDHGPELGMTNSYWVRWDRPSGERFAGPASVFVEGDSEALPVRVLYVRPNPTRSGSCFHYAQRDAGRVSVSLYTVAGRLVRTVESPQSGGTGGRGREATLCWDGAGDDGDSVASGVYMWRLSLDGVHVPEQRGVVTVVR